jgi:DNA repair exonuclease SbcCD nuclease subunit
MMETLRLLHTSDVHIGAPFAFLGGKGSEQRAALLAAFAEIARVARDEKYDVLIVAGDLFDAAFETSEADVSLVLGCLRGAAGSCRVVILPGGHDRYAPGSVFERERKRFESISNVRILSPGREVIDFPELSLAVHGRALVSNVPAANSFAGLNPLDGRRWNVCAAHCSVEGFAAGLDAGEMPARLGDLAPGFDYTALGHWHSFRVLRNDPPVLYCGAPEIVARDQQGAGFAVSVTLGGGAASFERRRIGRRRIERRVVDCTGLRSTDELVERALREIPPDGDLILDLSLGGLVQLDSALDPAQCVAELERHYFSVRLSGKGPSREISREELLGVSADTVAGAFVRGMMKRIEGAGEDERELYEEALQLGYQLFKGRDLIG